MSLILYRMIQKDVILFRILCLVPEYEIVQYRGVKDVEEISPVGISSSFEELRMSRDPHQVVSQESANAYFDKWYECIRK